MLDSPVSRPEERLSRRQLLGLSAAACGAALVLGALPAHAVGHSDQRALRFLEELELLETQFFTRVALSATADGLSERDVSVLNTFAKQDNEHALWFKMARRKFGVSAFERPEAPNRPGSRVAKSYLFPGDAFATRQGVLSTALALKTTAVATYHGQVGSVTDPDIIQALSALAGVEGRHLALLQELAGQSALTAFEPALSARQAARKLSKYGFIGGGLA